MRPPNPYSTSTNLVGTSHKALSATPIKQFFLRKKCSRQVFS